MAQDFSAKKQDWIQRFKGSCVKLMTAADELTVLCNEFTLDAYGTGGANALTDADVQAVLPAATAALVWYSEGQLANTNAVLDQIKAARGGLEMMRP